MNVAQRLRRLERDLGAAFACPVCEGHGTLEMVFAEPGQPAPKGTGCRRCGKINVLMILREAKPPAAQEPTPASR
jgi:hypothetical protein